MRSYARTTIENLSRCYTVAIKSQLDSAMVCIIKQQRPPDSYRNKKNDLTYSWALKEITWAERSSTFSYFELTWQLLELFLSSSSRQQCSGPISFSLHRAHTMTNVNVPQNYLRWFVRREATSTDFCILSVHMSGRTGQA